LLIFYEKIYIFMTINQAENQAIAKVGDLTNLRLFVLETA